MWTVHFETQTTDTQTKQLINKNSDPVHKYVKYRIKFKYLLQITEKVRVGLVTGLRFR